MQPARLARRPAKYLTEHNLGAGGQRQRRSYRPQVPAYGVGCAFPETVDLRWTTGAEKRAPILKPAFRPGVRASLSRARYGLLLLGCALSFWMAIEGWFRTVPVLRCSAAATACSGLQDSAPGGSTAGRSACGLVGPARRMLRRPLRRSAATRRPRGCTD